MMMTCRLLCALLVLVLCCCPSVCAAEPTQHTEVKAAVAAISPSLVPEVPRKEIGNSGSPSNGSGAEKGSTAVAGPAPTVAGLESGDVSNTLQNHDPDGTPGAEISTRQSAEEASQEAEDPAETTTTTTTTYAPTTINTKKTQLRYRGANHDDDHPHRHVFGNRRQPQQLCVGVCPAAARRIRAGVHRSGL
ncbi:putative mucin TcMUCII, partial [Trypanosoma cruzi]